MYQYKNIKTELNLLIESFEENKIIPFFQRYLKILIDKKTKTKKIIKKFQSFLFFKLIIEAS